MPEWGRHHSVCLGELELEWVELSWRRIGGEGVGVSGEEFEEWGEVVASGVVG